MTLSLAFTLSLIVQSMEAVAQSGKMRPHRAVIHRRNQTGESLSSVKLTYNATTAYVPAAA